MPVRRAETESFLQNLSISVEMPWLLIAMLKLKFCIFSTMPREFNVHLCCVNNCFVQCNCSEMVANWSLKSY